MRSYLATFALAFLFGLGLTPLAGRLGRFIGAMDRGREPPIPRAGGLAIVAASALSLGLLALAFSPIRFLLDLSVVELPAVFGGAALILALGVLDDLKGLKAPPKFAVEILIAVGLFAAGIRASTLWLPLGIVELGTVTGLVFTVVWIVGITNAFNLLDGMDGLAAGSAVFALLAVFVTSVSLGQPLVALLTVAVAGATLGFLPFNFAPARIYLGDAGSLFLGFILATLSIKGATKGPTMVALAIPLVAFAVPVLDTAVAVMRRAARGAPLFQGDREHLHHRLLALGLTPRQAVGLLYVASGAFALASMLLLNPNVRSLAVVLTMVGAIVYLAVRHLRLYEFSELARIAQRGLVQTRAISFNVDVRRAAQALRDSRVWDDIVGALARLFADSEFDAVRLVLYDRGSDGPRHEFLLEDGRMVERRVPVKDDEWGVHLPFQIGQAGGVRGELAVFRRYGRREMLTDVNLLVEVLRPALAAAASRVAPPTPARAS